jgi:GcrA cell cycle regulator
MSWTEQRIDTLKQLWADGLSASQIAGRLGGVTRNAVIGKVYRLGLAGRATTSRSRPRLRSTRPRVGNSLTSRQRAFGNPALRRLLSATNRDTAPTADELTIPLHERKIVSTLTPSCCRWPIGDPKQADFHFCSRTRFEGFPYCVAHALRAFSPARAKAR